MQQKISEIDHSSPTPIYHQLVNILKKEAKKMAPNRQFYTENKLTEKFSISRQTAIRTITELVKDGYLYRQRGKGTFIKGQQEKRKCNKILLFVPEQFNFDIFLEYFGVVRLIQGVTDEVSKKNEVLLLTIPKGVDETEFCIERISDPTLDGIILLPYKNLKSIITIAKKNRKPYVLLNMKQYVSESNSIIADECCGVAEAINYLISLRHRNIAFIGNQDEYIYGRFHGYKQAIEKAKISFDEQMTVEWSAGTLNQDIDKLLSMRPDTTAIITGNDYIASKIIEYLRSKHIAVPEDISVVGFDNMSQAKDFNSILTTINKPHYEMGQAAAIQIDRMISEDIFEIENYILPTRLIKGESTTIARH